MQSVAVLGGVSYNLMVYLDEFPQPVPQSVFSQGYHETIGETGAGKALNLHRLGFEVRFHALIGDDAFGAAIRDYLEREGVRFAYDRDPKGTQRHVNLMDRAGRRISIIMATGSPDPTLDLSRVEKMIAGSAYTVVNLDNYCRRLIPVARRHGKDIWCDIHDYDGKDSYYRDFIEAADYLFLSSDVLSDYRPFMERQRTAGKRLVVCTHGAEGSTALTEDGIWIETPIVHGFPVRDTNGAGDAFFAGVLYGHTLAYPTDTCMRLGTLAAGLCVTSLELAYPDMTPALLAAEYRRHYGVPLPG